jgi:hypothetical protein
MQLVASRYNVNVAIRRLNAHNFGHSHLYLVDHIDLLARELFGVVLYPNHPNAILFTAVPGVTSVGIVQLLHESKLVISGSPHPSLKGDLLFMAQKMNVQCPPLPFGSHAEYRMFNSFMERHPKASTKDILSFCMDVLTKVDFKTISPKTVPLFRAQYIRWKEASLIRCLNLTIKPAFDPLLKSLARPVAASSARGSTTMVTKVMPLYDPDRAADKQVTENNVEGMHNVQGLQAPILGVAKPGLVLTAMGSADKEMVKKCYYWPCCKSCATICGGHHKDTCRDVSSGEITLPKDFMAIKTAARKKEYADEAKKRRAAAKSTTNQKTKRKKAI